MTSEAPAPASIDLEGPVRAVMDEIDHVVTATMPVDEVLELATGHGLPRVIVVNDLFHVVGVVSQRDMLKWCLMRQAAEDGRQDSDESTETGWNVPIERLITREHPVTVLPEVPVVKAAAVLATNKVSCLPVVGHSGRLQGVLTTSSLLRHIRSKARESIADEFTFFVPSRGAQPSAPAYIRRLNGDIVIPKKCIVDTIHVTDTAEIGYNQDSGRILIRFVARSEAQEGSQEVVADKEQYVIRAQSFVEHFGLSGSARTYSVEHSGPARQYLLLSPRVSGT